VRPGNVYALTDKDGSTRVKRVDIVPNEGYILRSDAPDFPAELRVGLDAKAVRIEGQVVWSGHVWER
jgi:phage repressor protein C with HTH and peptisase S24 domain